MKRGGPLKRTKGLKRSRLNPRSDKKIAEDREWKVIRAKVLLDANYLCKIVSKDCAVVATDVHHIRPRGRGGSNDKINLIASCRACHKRVHLNPEWAYREGWTI